MPAGQDQLAPSGPSARIDANLAALEILARLEADARPATGGEQAVLARWSGWGAAGVSDIFDERRDRFAAQRDRLRALLGEDGFAAARRTSLSAHYTDPEIDRAVWAAVTGLGFTGGRVLEPGCGAGTFIGTAPASVRIEATGIELDPATARVAAALYPSADIRAESFTDTLAPTGYFDLTIGNVPFADVRPHDPRFNQGRHALHNYFIIKSLHLTRPGGLVAVLTSHHTMDAVNPAARRDMNALADLVTAVRLPSGALRRSAGTEAVTDLLILRRREPGTEPASTGWEKTIPVELPGPGEEQRAETPINTWFTARPELVLGRQHVAIGLYGAPGLQVTAPDPADTTRRLSTALTDQAHTARSLGLGWQSPSPDQTRNMPAGRLATSSKHPAGHIRPAADGGFEQLTEGVWTPVKLARSHHDEFKALLGLRDQARALLTAEAATMDDTSDLAARRTRLHTAWQSYVDQYGPVGRVTTRRTGRLDADGDPVTYRVLPPATRLLRTDPYGPLVFSLEHTDETAGTATPGPLLTGRVVVPRKPVTGVETTSDAIAVSLDQRGRLDLDLMADLLGLHTPAQIAERLAADNSAFPLPEDPDLWVTREEYLSGNVRIKLEAARDAARTAPDQWARNVQALTAVLPEPLGPAEIEPRIGAIWIPSSDYTDFLRDISEDPHAAVTYVAAGEWSVTADRYSVQSTSVWGTERVPLPDLLGKLLTQKPVTVHDNVPAGPDGTSTRRAYNPVESDAARSKADALQARFADWLWQDPARADRLVDDYNRRFNSTVLRDYGTAGQALTLPGLAKNFTPRPHQLAAVARIIGEPSVGLFHEVGAGKTAEMVMGCMELRRLGLVTKPAVVVPDHMLEQFSREWLQLYPAARILAAGTKDADATHRRALVARAATGNWDAIILSRGAFRAIDVTPQTKNDYLRRELDLVRSQLEHVQDTDDPAASRTVKQIEKTLARREEQLQRRQDLRRDPGLCFEETGIDYLFVDELHDFKNLETVSNIQGAAIAGSKRASDLHMKIDYLRHQHGSRVVTGATATPIANSITELYVMQRYLDPDALAAAGIECFDEWAATFAETVSGIEVSPDGKLRAHQRFARFTNVPELVTMLHTYGDIKTAADLNLPTPDIAPDEDGNHQPHTVMIQPSPELKAYQAKLGDRADMIAARGVDPRDDNMLKLSSDGRRAALDLRLVNPDTTPSTTKIETAADLLHQTWLDTRTNRYLDPATGAEHPRPGALQLVFCDMGTPGPDKPFSVYDALKTELTARGMPPEAIRYIQDARTDDQKAALFAACRTGEVAVLIGSSAMMGTGVNVQDRAIHLLDLDAPWRPADLTQRHGRILRQGNQNPQIRITQLVTAESFDSYMWQTLERKARFINQIMHADLTARDMEDIGADDANLFAQTKAIASGNPLLLRQAEAEQNLQRLRRLATAHTRDQQRLHHRTTQLEREITATHDLITALDHLTRATTDTSGQHFTITITHAGTYTNRADAARSLAAACRPTQSWTTQDLGTVAHLGGHDITASWQPNGRITFRIDGSPHAERTIEQNADFPKPGTITRLENTIRNLDSRLTQAKNHLPELHAELANTRNLLGKPFTNATELASAQKEYDTVTRLMAEQEHSQPATNPDEPDPRDKKEKIRAYWEQRRRQRAENHQVEPATTEPQNPAIHREQTGPNLTL